MGCGTKTMKFEAEFVILTVDDKPEDNFRKVAEKGIRLFIVEKPNKNVGLYSTEIDITASDIYEAIQIGLQDITKDATHVEILKIKDKIDRDVECTDTVHTIKFTVLVIVRQSSLRSIVKNSKLRGTWVWVDTERDIDSLSITKAKLVNNLYNPTVVLDSLDGTEFETVMETVEYVRKELYFSNILFYFMNETFTLKEFEESFNTLNGKEVTNMKKKWANKFKDTGEMSEGLAHRPAKLYSFNGA